MHDSALYDATTPVWYGFLSAQAHRTLIADWGPLAIRTRSDVVANLGLQVRGDAGEQPDRAGLRQRRRVRRWDRHLRRGRDRHVHRHRRLVHLQVRGSGGAGATPCLNDPVGVGALAKKKKHKNDCPRGHR